MSRAALLAASLISTFFMATHVRAQDDAELRDYLSANGLLNRGLYDMAAEEYRKFLVEHADHPKATVARYGLAVCLFRTQSYAAARVELEKLASARDFEYAAETRAMLGQTLLMLGEYEAAAGAFSSLLRSYADHDLADDAQAGLVEALSRLGKSAEAIEQAKRFVAQWPKSPLRARVDYFWSLADIAEKQDARAAQRLENLLSRQPADLAGQATLLLAQCRHRLGELNEAEAAYRKAIELAPEQAGAARIGLASVLRARGDARAAAESLASVARDASDPALLASAHLERGRALFDQGQFEQAIAAFEQAATAGAPADQVAYWVAKCLLRQEKFTEAAERLERALRDFSDSGLRAEMCYDRAVALHRAHALDAARQALIPFGDVLSEHSLAPAALALLGQIEHQDKRYDACAALCRGFLERYRDHELASTVAFLAAENEFLAGRYEEALKRFSAFERDYPNDSRAPQVAGRIGLALHQLGRYEEAEKRLSAAPARSAADTLALGDSYFQRGQWKQAADTLEQYLSADEPPAADEALLKLGLSLQRQGKSEEALKRIQRLLDGFPDSPHRAQALFEKGQALLSLKRTEEARTVFEELCAMKDGADRFRPYAENHLSTIAQLGGDDQQALERLDHVLADAKIDPLIAADALLRRAQTLLNLQRSDQAERDLRRFIEEFPKHDRVNEARARLATALSRQERAEEALALVASLEKGGVALPDPLRDALTYEKALSLERLKRPTEAARAYRALLSASDLSLKAFAAYALAEIEASEKRLESAMELFTTAREGAAALASDAGRDLLEKATYRRGVCAFELKQLDVACAAFDELLDKFPQSALAASAGAFAGEAHFSAGRMEKAAQRLARVVEEGGDAPCVPAALLRYGDALAGLQRWAASERAFADYLDRFPSADGWPQAQFGLGWARENLARYDEAIAAYRPVVERHKGPTAARAQFQIGECLYAKKQYDEAARELLKVDILYAYPEWSAAALFEAGRCLEQLGKSVEARRQFQTVVEKHNSTKWGELAAQRLAALGAALPGRE